MKELVIHNLSVFYKMGKNTVPVLKNVNLCIDSNQIYGLIGRTGSGKTTLIKTISGILPTNATFEGIVEYKGRPLSNFSNDEKKISVVLQDPFASLNPTCVL